MTALDTLAGPLAQRLLGELMVELGVRGRPVCRGYLAHGVALPPAETGDCRCTVTIDDTAVAGSGEAWARITEITPAAQAAVRPGERRVSAGRGCTHNRWALGVELGVYRPACAVPDDAGTVDPVQRTADALTALADAAAIRCVLAASPLRMAPGRWTAIGPTGGVLGGMMSVTVELPECKCRKES